MDSGLDANNDGTLEDGEVQHTAYVCGFTPADGGADLLPDAAVAETSDGPGESPDQGPVAICGNGIIEPGEQCDPPSPFPSPGSGPQPSFCGLRCELSNPCEQCKTECADPHGDLGCEGLPAPDRVNCHAADRCSEANCTFFAKNLPGYRIDPLKCFCGTADYQSCQAGAANGACKLEYEAAAGTTDPVTIFSAARGSPLIAPLSMGLKLATCGIDGHCGARLGCIFGSSPPPTCGNDSVDVSEECDIAQATDFPTCRSSCRFDSAEAPGSGSACKTPSSATWSLVSTAAVDISAVSDTSLWTVDGSDVRHWDGSTFTARLHEDSGASLTIWAANDSDVWVGGVLLRRWDGVTWSDVSPPGFVFTSEVWGTSPDNVWAVGKSSGLDAAVAQWDGLRWTDRTPPAVLSGGFQPTALAGGGEPSWGADSSDLWLPGVSVQASATDPIMTAGVIHWDGTDWTTFPLSDTPATSAFGVWGTSRNNVWVVGSGIWHYDGTSWTNTFDFTGSTAVLKGIWGSCATDVWAAGRNGGGAAIWHFNGLDWFPLASGVAGALTAVTGVSIDDVWVAGTLTTLTDPSPGLIHRHH